MLSYSTIDCGYVTKRLLNAQISLDFKHQTFGPRHAKNLHKPEAYIVREDFDPIEYRQVFGMRAGEVWRDALGDPRMYTQIDEHVAAMGGSGMLREMRHRMFDQMLKTTIPRGYRRALEEVCRAMAFKTTDCARF